MISHLFFTDDSFFFFRATREECATIHQCFSLYEAASDQVINYLKSSISFSFNTTAQDRVEIYD